MKDIICKCGHPVSEHRALGMDMGEDRGSYCQHGIGPRDWPPACPCVEHHPPLIAAIVEAAMRYEDESGGHEERALFAAVRALREATKP